MPRLSKHDEWIGVLLHLIADPASGPEKRLYAAEHLVRAGQFATAEPTLQALAARPETAPAARRLLAVTRQLQRWGIVGELERYVAASAADGVDAEGVPFGADSSVMVARRPRAARTILVFTGAAKQIWIAIHLFHQLLPADCHVVYLQDPRTCSFAMGIDALGPGYTGTLRALQALVADLGAPQLYCIGSSIGGYGALRYGLDLPARRVLALSAATDLTMLTPKRPEFERLLRIEPARAADIWPPGSADLLELYRAAPRHPQAILAFGGANGPDAAAARRMAVLPGVALHEVPGHEQHDVVAELIASGEIRGLIERLLAD